MQSSPSNPYFVDTHCHLDAIKTIPLSEILEKAKQAGVIKIITVATNASDLNVVSELAHQHPEVFCTQGVHPHDAKDFNDDTIEEIKENIRSQTNETSKRSRKIVAIGEIGLDYYYDFSPRTMQLQAFEKQLQLAAELALPVIIHARDADEDMIAIIKNAGNFLPANKKGVFHSFSSGRKLAETALEEGFYLGFSGMITFKNADNVRQIVSSTPIERILLETDAPFLAPLPHRGKENAPHYLPLIGRKLAEIKNVPASKEYAECYLQLYQNSIDLFSLV